MTTAPADRVAIIGTGEAPYTRHPRPGTDTALLLADAVARALQDAGLGLGDVDGFGVASFTLDPDHAVDLAWRLGLGVRWLMQDTNGGASAGGLLQHAVRAVEAGDAEVVVLVAGDLMDRTSHERLVRNYNRATADHLAPLPMTGPNALFAMLTTRQMQQWGVVKEDYGRIVVAQREWAARNPGAVYRTPLSLEDYLGAPSVATPLGRYDCVPPVAGADAVVVARESRANGPAARVLSVVTSYNDDNQTGDGLITGVRSCAASTWERTGVDPGDIDVVSVYDDYPAMVISQLCDLGLASERDDLGQFIRDRVATRSLPVNTSGGQLSAGQAGSAGGMHGLVEVVRQLRGQGGERQVSARIGVVTGYGMVLYRHGACGNVAVLEATA